MKKAHNHKYNQKNAEKKKSNRTSGKKKRDSDKTEARTSLGKGKRKSLAEKTFEREIAFFKSVVANDANMKTIKLKLKSTTAERMKMMKNKQMDFLENFPFFFTHPQLVSEHNVIREVMIHNMNDETQCDM